MDHKRRLAYAMVKHLKDEASHGKYSEDVSESLEEKVAIQCLEQSFNVDANSATSELDCGRPLLDVFIEGTKAPEVSAASKADAEEHKQKGNQLMKDGFYEDAVNSYTKAIEIDQENPIFFSNRAAAYTKLGKNDDAINDCKVAVRINPEFSRAYGRMGLAQMNKEAYEDARQSYKKALYFDSENAGYKTNLELVEQKIAEKKGPTPAPGGGGFPNLGGLDIGSLLSNPAVMNMAQSFMQNPQMQQMFTGMMGGANQESASAESGAQPQQPFNMQDVLGATQNFAQHLQQDNPELVEQLRGQFKSDQPDQKRPDQ